jgi:threonine dehydrogenase-like Zn-dependent dehydrogenase
MEANRNFFDKAIAALHMERGTIDVLKKAVSTVRRGGVVSVLGVYGTSYDNFPFGQIFDKGVSFKTGQAPVHVYIDQLIKLVTEGKVKLDDIITHRLPLSEARHAYDIFNKKQDNCVKVVLKP